MNYTKGIAILNQLACKELQSKQPKISRINSIKRIKALAKRKGISLRDAYYIYQLKQGGKDENIKMGNSATLSRRQMW